MTRLQKANAVGLQFVRNVPLATNGKLWQATTVCRNYAMTVNGSLSKTNICSILMMYIYHDSAASPAVSTKI